MVDFDPSNPDIDATIAGLEAAIAAYRDGYEAYYERCKHPDSPAMRDPNAVVYLVPGVGMITFARDKATARISGEFYVNAINVMRGASSVSTYRGLPEQEAFDIEYWLLEEAKLQPHAQAEGAGRPGRLHHRRRRRHRPGDGARACCRMAPAWCWPISTTSALESADADLRQLRRRHGAHGQAGRDERRRRHLRPSLCSG